MKQEDFHNEKPRYYATDFPEIKEKIPDEKRKLYLEYEQQHNGIAQNASDDIDATNENSGYPEEQPVTLKNLQAITTDAIKEITKVVLDLKVTCPKCRSLRCFVKRSNGYFHCWRCNCSGMLEEMKALNHQESSRIDGAYYARAIKQKANQQKDKNYVPMVSSDYKEINEEVRSWLYPIYPL